MYALIFSVAVISMVDVSKCVSISLKPYNDTAIGMFVPTDLNGDGVLTKTELEGSFDKYDTNHDGKESRHEYTEFVCQTSPHLYQLSHYLFDEYDMDGDHHLVKADYDNLFMTMDTDHDGLVTMLEFVLYWDKVFPKYENVGVHGQTHAHGHSACH